MTRLIRKKGRQREVCTFWTESGSGNNKDVNLYFEPYFGDNGWSFSSPKQAMFCWYKFRERHPEKAEGWWAETEIKKCAPASDSTESASW